MSSDFRGGSLVRQGTAGHKHVLLSSLFVVAAALLALVAPGTAGAAASNFGVSGFDVSPSTTQQGANPNLSVSFDVSGNNDDLKSATFGLAPGLGFDPTPVPKCSTSDFQRDRCPAASQVGKFSAKFNVTLGPIAIPAEASGTTYALSNTKIGTVTRSTFFARGWIEQTVTPGAGGVQVKFDNLYKTALVLGLFEVPIQVKSLDWDYQGKAGPAGAGPVFITNPATCTPAVFNLTAVSYRNVTKTASDSYTPTGCGTTPTPPVVTITAPANGSTTSDSTPDVVFTATNSPTSTTCAVDGGAAAACTSPFTAPALADGAHNVVVTASNAGGSGSATVNFTVDTIDPVVEITAPADDSTQSSDSLSVEFSVTDATPTTTTCSLDGGAAAACTSPQNYSGLAAGQHTVVVTATDAASNTGSDSVTVTVEEPTPVPVVTITSPADGAVTSDDTPDVVFTATNSPTSVTCAVDGGAAGDCTSPFTTGSLTDGDHTVVVSATNVAGSGSDSVTFTVDTTDPVVEITAPADGSSSESTSTSVAFTVTDDTDTTTTCQLDAAAAAPCTSPQAYSGLSVGSHTVTVEATDEAGNTGDDSVTFEVLEPTPVPTVAITAPADDAVTGDDTPDVSFTTTNSPTSVTCAVDGGAAAACTSPFTAGPLADGSHNVVVTATNSAGSGSDTVTFTVDTTDPVVEITSPVDGSTQTSTSVSAAFSVDDETDTTTTCQLDAGAAAACTSPQAYSGLAVGSHTITVVATDEAGNTGDDSVTFTVEEATPAPEVTITSPANGSVTGDDTPDVSFTTTNSPTSVTCAVDGGAAAACSSPFTPAALSDGDHTIAVSASNASGSDTATVTITVDTTDPVVEITAPADGSSSSSTSTSVVFTVDDATDTTTTCALDGAAATACTSPQAYSGLSVGDHTVVVEATDEAGNTGDDSVTFTVDEPTPAPEVTITSPADDSFTSDTTPDVVFTATNSPTSTTCAIDGGAASACTSPFTPTLADGQHTVVVTATNAAGSGSDTVTFTVDATDPVVEITAPADGSSSESTSASVEFTVTDDTATTTTCQLDAGAATACTSPQAYSGLSVGDHTVVVEATDAAGNTGDDSVTFEVLAPTPAPTVTITSPADDAVTSDTTPSVTFTTTNSPTSVTCAVDAGAAAPCSSPFTTGTLASGDHTVVVTATNAAGSGSDTVNFTVDADDPVVEITSPADGSSQSETSISVVFTATDATTSVTGTTCALDGGAATSCTSPQAYSGLSLGDHTVVVTATDEAGNTGSDSVTVTVEAAGVAPEVTITDAPGPATSDTTPSYSFSATGTPAPTFTCSVDGGAATACTSPFTPSALTSPASHSFTVTATNSAGSDSATTYTFVDTRTYAVTTTLTKLPNSLTTAANVNAPAAHPDVNTTAELQGAPDTKKLTIVLPKGVNGSLAAIPEADRCSVAQAAAGTCPASSRIGSGTGTVFTTDSGTPVAVTGEGYLTDAPTASDAAGLALKATVAGGRGDIIATGGVQLVNNGSNQQLVADNIPTTTTTGVAFHANTLDVTLEGDIGGASHPLITNPSFCGAPSGTVAWAPISGSNPFGYQGPFVNVNATLESYSGPTATTNPAYTVTGCSAANAPYDPALAITIDSPAASTSTVSAALTVPLNNSSTQRIFSKMPPKFSANFASFGAPSDMCPTSAAKNTTTGATGVGNAPFSPASCPAQARFGQVLITTPRLEDPVLVNIYLINKSPLPWLGIHIDPTISPLNPQGVTVDLLLTTGLPFVNPTCDSTVLGEPCGGPGTGICDVGSNPCQQQISITAVALPDLPLTGTTLFLGKNADGSTLAGRVGTGGITSNDPLSIAKSPDGTCSDGADPNAVTPGTPYPQNASTQFVGWSQTTGTGTAVASGTKTVNQVLTTPGC